jgi:hypothetical protein
MEVAGGVSLRSGVSRTGDVAHSVGNIFLVHCSSRDEAHVAGAVGAAIIPPNNRDRAFKHKKPNVKVMSVGSGLWVWPELAPYNLISLLLKPSFKFGAVHAHHLLCMPRGGYCSLGRRATQYRSSSPHQLKQVMNWRGCGMRSARRQLSGRDHVKRIAVLPLRP